MGSYLSEPVTEKMSTDESNDKLVYGASSMQGWRVSQEDAHNSILDYDDSAAYFAVYDGHGGHEVAQYCSQKLPQYIKDLESYKSGNIEKALIEGFLGFDSSIATPEVVSVLKEIAGEKEADEDEDDEENVNNLYEEASMPIEKVIEKYTNLVNPTLNNLKKGNKVPRSPMILAKCASMVASASSSTSDCSLEIEEPCSSSDSSSKAEPSCSSTSNNEPDSSSSVTSEVNGDTADHPAPSNGTIPEIVISSSSSKPAENTINLPLQNGDITETIESENKEETTVDSSVVEDGKLSKSKGKSPMKKKIVPVRVTRPKRNATQLYQNLLQKKDDEDTEEDSEDEEDKTFEGPGEESSDDDDDGVNTSIEVEGSEEESEEDEDSEDGEEEEDELDDDDQTGLEFARNMKEEPGSDSGCTAVVALLKGRELYVANAGDSRCIVCRNGKAIDMSFDHKPEDDVERNRIVKAGGKVTGDGRVNGGLNLSRAIGDHAYKQNKELNDQEQMITALPDVKKLTIDPSEDEFMVLACDGIWNFMTSQQVVDFVKARIDNGSDKISHICEEMFDHCLAPNTLGDGTGCDNMTCIIVKFKSNSKKRCVSPEPSEEADAKRAKTETSEEAHGAETSSSSS